MTKTFLIVNFEGVLAKPIQRIFFNGPIQREFGPNYKSPQFLIYIPNIFYISNVSDIWTRWILCIFQYFEYFDIWTFQNIWYLLLMFVGQKGFQGRCAGGLQPGNDASNTASVLLKYFFVQVDIQNI